MNSLCWNCWWLGNPRLVHALHDMVRRWDPRIVFLLEKNLGKDVWRELETNWDLLMVLLCQVRAIVEVWPFYGKGK